MPISNRLPRHLAPALLVGGVLAGCATSPRADVGTAEDAGPRVLLVVTSQATLGPRPEATGLYLSEASHPWSVFDAEGFEVVLASVSGGAAPIDPRSVDLADDRNRKFLKKFGVEEGPSWRLAGTRRLDAIDPAAFDAVFFVGGHGTMWDFPNVESVRRIGEAVHRDGGVVAAVCHGPAALVGLRDASGRPLVEGRRVTSFTDSEEAAVALTEAMPFLLESRLRDLGAEFEHAGDFEAMVVVDDRIVTGQNPASATATAQAVERLLSAPGGPRGGSR